MGSGLIIIELEHIVVSERDFRSINMDAVGPGAEEHVKQSRMVWLETILYESAVSGSRKETTT